ncbi:hypothetical protein Q7469_11340 [Glaesserella parasuis]|uniref:Uncharacterized protein n=2 Tax=Glaesserella parasuis TaxID=738 RepID=A0A6M8SU71_GLAPU|nr:hypothetical protein [Glaesserella parasuis]MDD2168392.1 hypothetical protein [Glaesserella parasuis]MDG6302168.1 hypothetical protein [Glaesserella parasuis]MDG6344608.1 hypothetical protein [Glaesserella parasuis]MDG6346889.1 hypothetical protein [Glaesserella parasuis]MDG6377226.1 hypothetical protein [Glaesserella parasuis]
MSFFSRFKSKASDGIELAIHKALPHGYIFDTDHEEKTFIDSVCLDASSYSNAFSNEKLKGKSVFKSIIYIRKNTTLESYRKQCQYALQNSTLQYIYLCSSVDSFDILQCIIDDINNIYSTDGKIVLDLSNSKIYAFFHEYLLDDME